MKVRIRWVIHKWRGIKSGSHSIRTLYLVIYSDYSQSRIHHSSIQNTACSAEGGESQKRGGYFWNRNRHACTNTLYCRPYRSSLNKLIQGIGMKPSIKQGLWAHGACPPLVHYRRKNMQYAKPCKTFEGDMLIKKPAENIQGFDRTNSFWRGSFQDVSRIFKPCRSWADTCTKKL